MKFFVGYQIRQDRRFLDSILACKESISEVYFSWPGIANGRSTVNEKYGISAWDAEKIQRDELKELSSEGIGMNLLLNGNCYGGDSLSRAFYTKIGDLVDFLRCEYNLTSITTTSPVIAGFIKNNFDDIETRASVNMEIGTREGIEYLADVMDGYYAKRELNRSIPDLKRFSDIARGMGKKVYILANSGCLNHCSARQFHDNLVSHERDVMRMDNAFEFHGICRSFMKDAERRRKIVAYSNWIRPQDVYQYRDMVDGIKLATRVSENPEMIISAYTRGSYSGNILSLTEPDFSAMFRPTVLTLSKFPQGYFEKTAYCSHDCRSCGYCENVYDSASEELDRDILF